MLVAGSPHRRREPTDEGCASCPRTGRELYVFVLEPDEPEPDVREPDVLEPDRPEPDRPAADPTP